MKNIFKKFIFLLFILLISSNSVSAQDIKATRLGGLTRVETSIELSKNLYQESDTLILVNYDGDLEALLSTILAKKYDAPILVTEKNKLAASVKEEIERLGAENIILVSKDQAFSNIIKEALSDLQILEIVESNVEELALKILREVYGPTKDEVFLTLGYGTFADALSVGSVSAHRDIPILLTPSDSMSAINLEALKELGVKKVNIIGGTMAIHEKVEAQLATLGISFERIQGPTREDTAIKVSQRFNSDKNNIIVANGYNYADAVSGGYFAFKKDAGIVLTKENIISLNTLDHIKEKTDTLYILGGEKAVDSIVEKEINLILNGYTIKEESENIVLPFKTIKQDDPSMNKGLSKVKTQGQEGLKTILSRLVLKDHQLVEKRNLREKIVKKPIDKITLIGNRKIKKENLYFSNKNLNLKETTSSGSKTLLTIPKGTHLNYISTSGTWYKVAYKNKLGYLPSKLVSKGTGYKFGDSLIVNKGYGLSSNFNPGVNPEAVAAVNRMKRDAKKAGISLNVFSDFRSYNYQANLHNRYIRKDGKKRAETYSARAGHSEHQTGLAFDIGGANSKYYTSQKFGTMKEGIWMANNAHKYGLILRYAKGKEKITGYSYEPWHFRYVGLDLAKEIKNSKLSLDEFAGAVKANY